MEEIRTVLKHMYSLDTLNRWIFNEVRPFLGKRILEAGCGNGNLTGFYLKQADVVVCVDYDPVLIEIIQKRYSASHLHVFQKDLNQDLSHLSSYQTDTIVCLNVLEHIQNEETILKNFYTLLSNQGKIILQVPALPFLYGPIDKAVGHYRRYRPSDLITKVENMGFQVKTCHYFNFFGVFGWLWNGKIMRRPYLSLSLLSLFNFLLPIFKRIEKWIGPPIGLSVIMVAEKKSNTI